MEFDLIGVDASLANALRRIMIAEVPTVAIEKVFMMNNTSVIPDELLAHRIGLLPIKVHPSLMKECGETPTDLDTLVFDLNMRCEYNPKNKDAEDPEERYVNSRVSSQALQWMPQGDQPDNLKRDERPFGKYWKKQSEQLVYPLCDITIVKMRPGQEIEMQLHAIKGLGKDHAKWSPVSACSYRLLPEIIITKPITGKDAEKFKKCFPSGVIEIQDEKAVVVNARKDTVSRECLRHDEFKDKVILTRVRDHYIFHVESIGQYDSPAEIFMESCRVLMKKCQNVLGSLEKLELKLKKQ
jgi:DNA-directed RNA polymerase I and III subunit RPAC1